MRPQRHKRKRSPRSEHSLTGYLHAGWAGGKGGPTDPPSRSKHKGFQKISRKKKTRVPGVRESVRGGLRARGRKTHTGKHNTHGRTPGAPSCENTQVRKHKTGEKSEEPKTLKKIRSPARRSHSPRACKINPEALQPRSASQSQHHNAGASFSSNCGGPLFDVLQSACSYNTAIQQKCGPKDTSASVHPRSKTTRK